MSTDGIQRGTGPTSRSLLRWYPARWRARYGDEFIAMIEDDLGGRRPDMRYRLSIARSGLNERLRDAGLVGISVPSERVRGGALTVLCAFALFVIPGVAFAKISEHWDQSFQRGPRHLPAVSFNLLASLAGACGVAVALAAVALLPNFVKFVRAGGWPAIRRRVKWAVITTLATVAVVGGLAVWASHLTSHQRNTGFGWYQLFFVIAAVLFAAAVATSRRRHPSSRHPVGPTQGRRGAGCLGGGVHAPHDCSGGFLVGVDGDDRSLVPGRYPDGELPLAMGRQPPGRTHRDDDRLGRRHVRSAPGHPFMAPVGRRIVRSMRTLSGQKSNVRPVTHTSPGGSDS